MATHTAKLSLNKLQISFYLVLQKARKTIALLHSLMQRWQQNYHGRRQLAQLDQAQLKDIGISRSEALEEATKPFWRC